MRRVAAMSLSAALAASCLFGCGSGAADAPGFGGRKVASTDLAGQWECVSVVVDGREADSASVLGGYAILVLGEDGAGKVSVEDGGSADVSWRRGEPYARVECASGVPDLGIDGGGDAYVDDGGCLVWHGDGDVGDGHTVWCRSGRHVMVAHDGVVTSQGRP